MFPAGHVHGVFPDKGNMDTIPACSGIREQRQYGRRAPTDNVFLPQPKIVKNREKKTLLEVRLSEWGSCCALQAAHVLGLCHLRVLPLFPLLHCTLFSWTRSLYQSIPCQQLPWWRCCFSTMVDGIFTAVPFSSKGPWLWSRQNGRRDDRWHLVDADTFLEQGKMAQFQKCALILPLKPCAQRWCGWT